MPAKQYRNCCLDPCGPLPADVREAMRSAPRQCRRCGGSENLVFDPGELAYVCVPCVTGLAVAKAKARQGKTQ